MHTCYISVHNYMKVTNPQGLRFWGHISLSGITSAFRLKYKYNLCLKHLSFLSDSLLLLLGWGKWLLIDFLLFRRWWLGCLENWKFISNVNNMFSWDLSVRYGREPDLLIEIETMDYWQTWILYAVYSRPESLACWCRELKCKCCLNISKWNEQNQIEIQPFTIEYWPVFMDLLLLCGKQLRNVMAVCLGQLNEIVLVMLGQANLTK